MIFRFLLRAAPLMALLVLIPLVAPLFNPGSGALLQANPAAAQQMIAANRQEGRLMQALYQVEASAAQSGWTPELRRMAGDLWYEVGNLTNAVASWETALEGQPDDVVLIRQLASAYLDLRRWPQAADQLTHLIELVPDDRWAHYQLGLLLAAFDPAAAESHLRVAGSDPAYGDVSTALVAILMDNPGDSLNSMHVARALADRELWSFAELAFRHAADLNAPFPEALAYAGLMRDRQGRDGSEFVNQAVALDSRNSQVRYLQGLHLRSIGENTASLDAFIQAIVTDPQNPALFAELSTAYRLLGDLPRAEYWLKMSVAISGNDSQFQQLLALFYADEAYNLTSEGVDALGQTAVMLPNDPDVKASFGWALHTIGETEAGLAQIDGALEIASENPRALYYKARILLDTDSMEEAVRLFQRVASIESPFQEEVRRTLESLGR